MIDPRPCRLESIIAVPAVLSREDARNRQRPPQGAAGNVAMPEILGSGAGAGAHQADSVELGLLAGGLLLALADLVALVEQLDLLHLVEGLAERRLGVIELNPQLIGGALEVLAPRHSGLGIGRIGEMGRILNAGPVLLGFDLALEVDAHAFELG